MDHKVAIIISPNWGDYAKKYLADCLTSLRQQDFDNQPKLFLVDNATTAESYDYLRQLAPEAEIIRNQNNDGFAKGNNDALRRALDQGYDCLFLVNMDTIIDSHCLQALVDYLIKYPEAGAVQARLMLWSEQNKINSLGNLTHFLGFGYCLGYQQTYQPVGYRAIAYPSGAGVMLRATALRQIGLFDEELWMYNEDQDLGWRLWLAGYKCLLAEEAVIYHKYSFSKAISKYYWMDRNRLINIFKNYRLATLILILPALLVMELGLLLFAVKGGWLSEKIKVYNYFLKSTSWQYLRQARQRSQALRKVPDRAIIKLFSGQILYQEIDNVFLRLANVFFGFYWQIIRLLIFW
ncbi:MAG: glycosyltransferase family 2 protein [bacterium]